MLHTSSLWGVTGKTELHASWMCIAKGEKFQLDKWKKKFMGVLNQGNRLLKMVVGSPYLETLNTWLN